MDAPNSRTHLPPLKDGLAVPPYTPFSSVPPFGNHRQGVSGRLAADGRLDAALYKGAKMCVKYSILLLFSLLMLPQTARGELSYVGSSTIGTGILNAGAVETFRIKSGKKFTSVQIPGSGRGTAALIEGETSLAGMSRPLKPEEKKLGLSATVIGYDAIAVFVHAKNPVRNLSREQLKGIFTGRITSWQKVGGNLAAIAPTTEIHLRERATVEMFQEAIMDGSNYGDFRQIDLPRDQLLQLAQDPNGICAVSIGFLATLPANVRKNVKAVSVNG